ncbi:MAG: class I adenylate-forming enzyme family protein [Ilumatobacteraceae bacterium]
MRTFADPLRRGLCVAPDSPAVVDTAAKLTLTFTELDLRCRSIAGGFSALGLRPGDRVALLMANGHTYIESYVALPAAGFVIVPINTRLADPEIEYILRDAGVRALITDRPPSAIEKVVEHVIRVPDDFEHLIASASTLTELDELHAIDEHDLAGLFYTGGTTGPSKGVMLTHRNLIANMWNTINCCEMRADDRYLVMSPMFHAAGTYAVLASLALGATQVTVPAFDPEVVLDVIAAEGITTTLAVPTMMVALCESQSRRPRDTTSLRLLTHGASPVAVETVRRFHQLFPGTAMIHLYGATELSPLTTALADEQDELGGPRERSCGQPVLGCRVAIIDSDGNHLPAGESGEVVVRGDNVMAGYWNKPEETAAVLRNGWYRTGDVGWIDSQGFLFLVDRAKDMIVSGGENVYSTEVEQALMTHPGVLECAVYGIPDPRWGEAVAATVVAREGIDLTDTELVEHCRQLIAGFKVPRRIEVIADPLPKSAAGKILKREIREPFWEGHDARVSGA